MKITIALSHKLVIYWKYHYFPISIFVNQSRKCDSKSSEKHTPRFVLVNWRPGNRPVRNRGVVGGGGGSHFSRWRPATPSGVFKEPSCFSRFLERHAARFRVERWVNGERGVGGHRKHQWHDESSENLFSQRRKKIENRHTFARFLLFLEENEMLLVYKGRSRKEVFDNE